VCQVLGEGVFVGVAGFVEQGLPGWLRFAMVLTDDAWEAEDLCAEVVGRVFEQWTRISGARLPNAYVKRMIVNQFLSDRRRVSRSIAVADLDQYRAVVPDHSEAHAERDAVLRRLAVLVPRQRAAIVLRFYEGLTDEEVAQVLGCRVSTVRSLVSRALRTLRIDDAATAERAIPSRSRCGPAEES
jgi:RNA polymerase sigma factor (sigma-70 family)